MKFTELMSKTVAETIKTAQLVPEGHELYPIAQLLGTQVILTSALLALLAEKEKQ